jgi:hypothetical protein
MGRYYTGGYTVTENGRAYDDGYAAGGINARLANHDLHFKNINGSIAHLAREQELTRLELQRQADAAQAAADAITAAAKALEARRTASDRRWQPLNRFSIIIGVALGIAGIVSLILSFGH